MTEGVRMECEIASSEDLLAMTEKTKRHDLGTMTENMNHDEYEVSQV